MLKRLFFDIETSPLVVYTWRVGYRISIPHDNIVKQNKIICISWKWQHQKNVTSLTWDKDQNDFDMLKLFMKQVEEADECVAHNGDKYDIRWLRTRCAYHNIYCPDKIESYDTLKKARKQFNFNSNKLDYIAKFFNIGKKQDTGGFQLWVDVLNNDKLALKKMVNYCEHDVKILEQVFHKLYNYSEVNIHTGVAYNDHRWTCPKCGSQKIRSNGDRTSKSGLVKKRMRCVSCGGGWTITSSVYKNYLIWQYDKKKKQSNDSN